MTLHIPSETAMALVLAFSDARYGLPERRQVAAQAIDDLISFLDDTEGDPDLEDCGDDEDNGDLEPTLGSMQRAPAVATFGFMRVRPYYIPAAEWARIERDRYCPAPVYNGDTQEHWADGDNRERADDAEQVNEDGGDILDAPHDDEREEEEDGADDEPFLAWPTAEDQTNLEGGATVLDAFAVGSFEAAQDARHQARLLLRGVVQRRGDREHVVVAGNLPASHASNVSNLDGSPFRIVRMSRG